MVIQVREKTMEEIKTKLSEMHTDLNKITYIESVLKESGFSFEIKRFLYGELSEHYESRKMLDKAARASANKAGIEITQKDKIECYLSAAELYSRAGKVEEADDTFIRAIRDAPMPEQARIKLARKNIYLVAARELEDKNKKASASKFYERLIKMDLEESEKQTIKNKLVNTYNALGLFREAKLLEGL